MPSPRLVRVTLTVTDDDPARPRGVHDAPVHRADDAAGRDPLVHVAPRSAPAQLARGTRPTVRVHLHLRDSCSGELHEAAQGGACGELPLPGAASGWAVSGEGAAQPREGSGALGRARPGVSGRAVPAARGGGAPCAFGSAFGVGSQPLEERLHDGEMPRLRAVASGTPPSGGGCSPCGRDGGAAARARGTSRRAQLDVMRSLRVRESSRVVLAGMLRAAEGQTASPPGSAAAPGSVESSMRSGMFSGAQRSVGSARAAATAGGPGFATLCSAASDAHSAADSKGAEGACGSDADPVSPAAAQRPSGQTGRQAHWSGERAPFSAGRTHVPCGSGATRIGHCACMQFMSAPAFAQRTAAPWNMISVTAEAQVDTCNSVTDRCVQFKAVDLMSFSCAIRLDGCLCGR